MTVNEVSECVEILKRARAFFRESLSAFEFMDEASTVSMLKAFPDHLQNPFARTSPFTIFLEVEAFTEEERADERLFDFLETISDMIEVSQALNLSNKE